ncbi:MAG TPA: PspC domain-containing protein, partial [bacterium]|nr:PspC domain-containing protein [bacterium]
HRSRTDRWIAGVCGGLAEYLNVDTTPVRIAFVLLALWQGFGALLYLLMVIMIPDEPLTEMVTEPGLPVPAPDEEEDAPRRGRTLGAILVLGGAYLLLRESAVFTGVLGGRSVGVALILGGVILLLLRSRNTGNP